MLQSRGPTLTITQFADSFHQAVILAQSWLNENRCDYILLGSVDQYGEVMKYICGQKLKIADDGKIRPFSFSKLPVVVPGEGSVFFLMTNQTTSKKYASLFPPADANFKKPDMCILDCDGMCGSEEAYLSIKETGALVSSYVPIFGSMLTVSSFNCVAAALMLKNQCHYPTPIQDNPHGLDLCKIHQPAKIDRISCIKYGCKREKREFFLEK
jgi:3-oxoacyl-[acyl-carrier-protein] synthase II